jgi:hypothetical protein
MMKMLKLLALGCIAAAAISLVQIENARETRHSAASVSMPVEMHAMGTPQNHGRDARSAHAGALSSSRYAQAGDTFGDRIRFALQQDEDATSVLEQLRTELRADPPAVGRTMLQAMRTETDPTVLIILGNVLGENSDVMISSEAIDALVELTQSDLPAKRQAALAALSYANAVSPGLLDRVAYISRDDASNDVRISAIATMSVWMGRKPELVQRLNQELLATAHASSDTAVRGNAIQLIANQGQQPPDNVIREMAEFLKTETAPQNRQLAAYGLASATGALQAEAVAQLQRAYVQERHLETQRVLLMQLVRAGKESAPTVLASLPADNALLKADIKDYVELLAQGYTDPDDLWTQKSLRDAQRGTEIGATYSAQDVAR